MRSADLALASACCLSACLLPHVDRFRPKVDGLVTRDGVPAAGVRVARCTNGTTWNCTEYECGFDLEADGHTYWGIPSGGIGMPPKRYYVRCELTGAVVRESTDTPATARDKHVCKASGVVR
jgi:hypothetical protein